MPRQDNTQAHWLTRGTSDNYSTGLTTDNILQIFVILAAIATVFLLIQQNDQQQQIYIETRRAELLETIYGRRDCDVDNIEECPFVASIRVREEAAKGLIQLERQISATIDLRNADLSGANLNDLNLSHVALNEATMQFANLSSSDLSNTDLSGANLASADLIKATLIGTKLNCTKPVCTQLQLNCVKSVCTQLEKAELIGAKLIDVELIGAGLSHADLRGSTLIDVDLSYADLSNADLSTSTLQDVTFVETIYNKDTKWPSDFEIAGKSLVRPRVE